MKYSLYVEGKAEMLFVADILSKYSAYDSAYIGYKCINLNSDVLEYVKYPSQGDESSEYYYQIVNVNNDTRVISKMKHDIPNLVKQGFQVIIGLRDVFGEDYKALRDDQTIDMDLIGEMHQMQSRQIHFDGVDSRLHFAIMEYETWMMALLDNYILLQGREPEEVFEAVGVDYNSDFEATVFHPYNKVQKIFQLLDSSYGKHESDQFSFLSYLAIDDYERLRNSSKCVSFRSFVDSLLPLQD